MQRFLPTYLPRVGSVVGGFVVVRTSTLSTSIGLLIALSWSLLCVVVATCDLPLVIVALSALNGPVLVDYGLCYFDGNNVF